MKLLKVLLTASAAIGISISSFAAINININSGNPVMPFPQFMDYVGGETLASHLPDGVSHAEMEMWMRDAWKIHSNEFNYAGTITYQNAAGANVNVNLIKDTSSPYCSEGHGYALLGAALMCDKDAFDGLWFYLVENNYFNKSKIYSTNTIYNPGYNFGAWAPAWAGPGSDAATDGDDDIALACLIAWKQWGDNTGYYAPGGSGANNTNSQPAIQYKQMALDLMRFMVEKDEGDIVGDAYYDSGDIGFDGYVKGGNTWPEVTNWAISQPGDKPNRAGPQSNSYYDYTAPGYYRCFGEALQANGDPAWNYNQFFRATAASNWVMGRLAASSHKVVDAGQYSITGSTVTFQNFNVGGEDFRAPLRNILDYLWNGNPTEDWDPVNHAITAGGNTWQYNAAIKQANFYRNPQATGLACKTYGSSKITFNGVAALTAYNLDGSEFWTFHLNRFGASAPAIVASQDFDLMGQFFRELMIEWDVATPGDNYLSSVPAYFHGFFRQVGLMILTGNWPNACDIMPTANMKVYKSTDKTYGFPGDIITYWINYRNYGSMDATNVTVRDTLPSAIEFVSSVPAPVFSDSANGIYEWGGSGFTVTGMRNQNYGATMGGITVVARVKSDAAQGRYCNFADIRCSNGTGWTSSEFPNEVSAVLRRNCIDIVSAALTITKTAGASLVGVGDTVTYTIDFCNSAAAAGWINGGRSGVNWAAGVNPLETNSSEYKLDFAAHHEAAEPVIDWSNYRISYFVNSELHGTQWGIAKNSSAPFDATISMTTEDFVACMPTACTDATGQSWNQRLMMTFNSMPSTPTHHLYNYYGMMSRIHMGTVTSPFYFEVRLFDSTYMNPQDWTDDWSQQTTAMNVSGPDQPMFPINPDWTKGDGTSVTWNKVNKHACETTPISIDNILVEEWDGYTWRRVFGNGPMPGREVTGVHVVDSLPAYLTFGGVVSAPAGATLAQSGKSLDWTIGDMQINQCGQIVYYAVVTDPGCPVADTPQINKAFVYGDKEAPVSDDALVTIRCGVVPTFTSTPTATRTSTSTVTITSSPSQTASPTSTATNTITPSSTVTLTATTTVTITASPTSTDTKVSTLTSTATVTSSATSTLTSTPSSSATMTSTMTSTPSVSPSSTFTQTPTLTITQTETTIIISATITLTWTASPTMTATPTATVTITSTNTSTDTETATSTFTNTATDTPTETYTYTYTATSTDTSTSTATYTYTASDTVTGTPPPTNTFTQTFTHSNTMTYTDTATNTNTRTFTNTFTETFTYTQTSTFTDTFTATNTRTPSFTATNTNTFTNTFTHTATFTSTFTATHTNTPGPTPVELEMGLKAWGENPKVGAKITYQIVIKNPYAADTWNINVWDSLPAGTKFVSASTPSPYSYSLDGDVISWDFAGVSLNAQCYPGTPSCVDEITVEFTVEITQMPADRVFENSASADYNDYAYPNYPKHPIIDTGVEYYPGGMPVIYPNPFNPQKAKDGRLKIDNVPPGSVIQIYTVAGENVISIQAENIIAYWYGKNKYGNDVSPGLYFITIHNKANGKVQRAKLFVVGN